MKKLSNYILEKLWNKHTSDGIHGYDIFYNGVLDDIKRYINNLNNTSQLANHELIKDTKRAFNAIDDIKNSNLKDKELVEYYIRLYIKNNLLLLNECIDEIKEN